VVHLADSRCQHAHNLLMRYGNDTLSVDVDDAMADPHSTTLRYASSQQTTDLYRQYNTITSDVHSESEAQAVTRGEDAKAGLTEHTHPPLTALFPALPG